MQDPGDIGVGPPVFQRVAKHRNGTRRYVSCNGAENHERGDGNAVANDFGLQSSRPQRDSEYADWRKFGGRVLECGCRLLYATDTDHRVQQQPLCEGNVMFSELIRRTILTGLLVIPVTQTASAADWPTYRGNNERTGAAAESLAAHGP